MKQAPEELLRDLAQFTGTEHYYRMLPRFVVTDGVKYLMDQAGCYWLAQLMGSHLLEMDTDENAFTVLELKRSGAGAVITIGDGNDHVIAHQVVEYTDFPFDEFRLYGCWAGEFWVGMLTSEY